MCFSLRENVENKIGEGITKKQVKKDLKRICKNYRKEKGYFKTIRVTNKRIFYAFLMYKIFNSVQTPGCTIWSNFVTTCERDGAEFLDMYIS